jgi:hypothetical protein
MLWEFPTRLAKKVGNSHRNLPPLRYILTTDTPLSLGKTVVFPKAGGKFPTVFPGKINMWEMPHI